MTGAPPTKAGPLVAARLHVPRRRDPVVHRARLARRFGEAVGSRLTLVAAPAGFGKTTLVADWIAADDLRAAWVSLGPGEDDGATFWSYVLAALDRAAPGVGDAAASLLAADPTALDAVVVTLLNELDRLSDDVVLVLDDYHVITSMQVHDAVATFVAHVPVRVHLVVVTRADPPLPLARMRARHELTEIRAADLRFTEEEAGTYLREVMGLDLDLADLRALDARTEGWIAALQLAGLSLQQHEDASAFIAGFAGDDRFVVDYLAEEVLERLPAEARSFLVQTAILRQLSGPLCDAVIGGTDSQAMLESLERANLFVVPLDDQRRWWRYHHLFADVLRTRLVDVPVTELHRRAASWYEANGDQAEAIEHAVAGGDVDRAARLIEVAAPGLRQRRQEAVLRRWLEALPGEIYDDRPVLSAFLVGARLATGDTTGVASLLASAERWLDGQEVREGAVATDADELRRLPGQVAMYRAGLALLTGDRASASAHAARAFELADPSDHLLLGAAAALTGLARWAAGDLEHARARYASAVESLLGADHLADVLGCCLALADIEVALGALGDAQRTLERGLALTRRQPGLRGSADMHVALSEVMIERDDLDAAARHLDASDELGERAGLPQHAYRWRVAAARLLAARGDAAAALELLDDAERVYDTDFSPAVRPISALRARVLLGQGDLRTALAWVDRRGLRPTDELSYVREYEHLTLARVLVAQAANEPALAGDAISLLERLRSRAADGHRTGSLIEALVLLAAAHRLQGDDGAANASLTEALALAEPEGFVRVFLEQPVRLAPLEPIAAGESTAGRHARHVLAQARPRGPAVRAGGLVDGLSSRELDVLRLLRSDLSGPDIARELYVSLNTLRTHTKSIYSKLGVSSRREAVRRAAELGL